MLASVMYKNTPSSCNIGIFGFVAYNFPVVHVLKGRVLYIKLWDQL